MTDKPTNAGDHFEVVYALNHRQQCVSMPLTNHMTARQALLQVLGQGRIVLANEDAQVDPQGLPIGVYGQLVGDDYRIQAGDRLEIYRALQQDPMERRRRVARQSLSDGVPSSTRFSQKKR